MYIVYNIIQIYFVKRSRIFGAIWRILKLIFWKNVHFFHPKVDLGLKITILAKSALNFYFQTKFTIPKIMAKPKIGKIIISKNTIHET